LKIIRGLRSEAGERRFIGGAGSAGKRAVHGLRPRKNAIGSIG
jgi:hypothetical protein